MSEGNPIHWEMMEAAKLAGLNYIINSVRNSAGKIVEFVSGPPEAAFYEGVRICKEINSVKISEPGGRGLRKLRWFSKG